MISAAIFDSVVPSSPNLTTSRKTIDMIWIFEVEKNRNFGKGSVDQKAWRPFIFG